MMKKNVWIASKWFLTVNLVCFALPVLPFLFNIFMQFTLNIKTDFGLWDISRTLFMVPLFSIPLSIAVVLYKVRYKKENNDKKLQSDTISSISVGFRTFGLSILILW